MTAQDPMPFGKHKGVALKDVPKSYSDWLCKQDGFAEKYPQLYKFFTEGEEAVIRPVERSILDEEAVLINSVSTRFREFWFKSYGHRLRKDGEVHYIAYLRIAVTTWSACEAALAKDIVQPVTPEPVRPPPPPDRSAPPAQSLVERLDLSSQDVGF